MHRAVRLLAAAAAAALLLCAASPLRAGAAGAAEGIGMSGSLADLSPLKVPAGSIVSSDSLFVVVYNYGRSPVKVRLGYDAPPGIRVVFDPNASIVDLAPGESKRFRVIVNVSDSVVPGTYRVYVRAYIVKKRGGGVAVIPGVSERLVLQVVGEYSDVAVKVVDPGGGIARTALVRLCRRIHGRLVSVVDARGGLLEARVVPGDYVVRAFLAGELAAEKAVHLAPGRYTYIVLHAKVLYIERFNARLDHERGVARIHVVLKNLYHTLQGVNVILYISHDGRPLEARKLVASSTVPPGRSEYFLDYAPPGGWSGGNYTFQVVVTAFGGRRVAASRPVTIVVPARPPLMLAGLAAAGLAATAVLAWSRRKRNEEAKKP